MSDDPLAPFRDPEGEEERTSGPQLFPHEVLVFEYQGTVFAVAAARVAGVIAWRDPWPVPAGGDAIAGVVQDSGRIIVVARHPTGIRARQQQQPTRIVLCDTDRGNIGLPATATRAVETLELPSPPTAGQLLDIAGGVASFVDPDLVLARILGTGGATG